MSDNLAKWRRVSYWGISFVFVSNVAFSVVLFEVASRFFADVPIFRQLLRTGVSSSPNILATINDNNDRPVVLEAIAQLPLRESPPRASGLLPLQKGIAIGQIKPNTEWIVVDSVNVRKLTGDDTWVRIANKNQAEKVLAIRKIANTDELKALLDSYTSPSGEKHIENGWAYLGKNFTLDNANP